MNIYFLLNPLETLHSPLKLPASGVYYDKFLNFFFIPKDCMQYIDMVAEAADISIGKVAFLDESFGYSLFIIRTDEDEKFFRKAIDENIVASTDIDPWKIIKSQPYYCIKKGKVIKAADKFFIPIHKIVRRLEYTVSSRKRLYFVIYLWTGLRRLNKHDLRE